MNSLITRLARIPWRKLLYPALLALVLGIVITELLFSTRFLTNEFNRIFIADTLGDAFSIDLAHYRIVAQKISLPSTGATQETTAAPIPAAVASTSVVSATSAAPSLDKKALTIGVYNATGVIGLAGKLKTKLETDGFVVAKTGNVKSQPTNTVEIKKSKRDYLPLLATALGTDFDVANATTLSEDVAIDCILTIGKK